MTIPLKGTPPRRLAGSLRPTIQAATGRLGGRVTKIPVGTTTSACSSKLWRGKSNVSSTTITPKKLQKTPHVGLIDALPDVTFPWHDDESLPQLTLALTDPDAKSRDNPIWSEMCHWIATEVPLTGSNGSHVSKSFKDIVPYKPPGPPPKTGKHRYVFAALAPRNGTHETLNLTVPADRQHWGYGQVRRGLRDWAEDNGLVVVGANFIYAQDRKQ